MFTFKFSLKVVHLKSSNFIIYLASCQNFAFLFILVSKYRFYLIHFFKSLFNLLYNKLFLKVLILFIELETKNNFNHFLNYFLIDLCFFYFD